MMTLQEAIAEIKKHRAMICSELPEGPLLTALQAVADGTLIPADELPTDDTDELISIADLLEAAEKGIKELEMDLREAENRANKFATKEMHTEKRALKAEAERDQALASVGAVIEQAAAMVATPDEDDDALDRQTRRIASEQLRCDFNPDATAALNEMLADAWDEGRLSSALDRNPYRP